MRILIWLFAILAIGTPAAVKAEVVVAFYSHDLDLGFKTDFPHAFIVVKGETTDGRNVDTNYGFTAKSVSPALLMGSVSGTMETLPVSYYKKSVRQFAVKISDVQYDSLLSVVEKWRAVKGKSYNLDKRNCIHFVSDVALTLGLKVVLEKKLIKKPVAFMQSLIALNPWVRPVTP
ncbi:MAG: hypothetical protein ABL918_01435 [Chakrabartia sp.]